MVRAGIVKHPSEWPYSGYNEIQEPPKRYAIIDQEGLKELLNFQSMNDLAAAYRGWIDEALSRGALRREGKWTESIAVGSESFVHATQTKLGIKGHGREVIGVDGSYELRESSMPYAAHLAHENDGLRLQNGFFWNDPLGMSAT